MCLLRVKPQIYLLILLLLQEYPHFNVLDSSSMAYGERFPSSSLATKSCRSNGNVANSHNGNGNGNFPHKLRNFTEVIDNSVASSMPSVAKLLFNQQQQQQQHQQNHHNHRDSDCLSLLTEKSKETSTPASTTTTTAAVVAAAAALTNCNSNSSNNNFNIKSAPVNSKYKKSANSVKSTLIAKKTKFWKYLEEEQLREHEEKMAENYSSCRSG